MFRNLGCKLCLIIPNPQHKRIRQETSELQRPYTLIPSIVGLHLHLRKFWRPFAEVLVDIEDSFEFIRVLGVLEV